MRGHRRLQDGTPRSASGSKARWAPDVLDGDDVGAMTNQVLALRDHLAAQQVTVVVMEATGGLLAAVLLRAGEPTSQVLLVNARECEERPGPQDGCFRRYLACRSGRSWPAPGFVRATGTDPATAGSDQGPDQITQERTREIQRLEKLLEDAGIKLSSVASDITGVSGRLMLQALIDSQGTADPAVMADLAKRRMRSKIPMLTEALNGTVHRPSRVHDPAVPGPDRRPHHGHRRRCRGRIEGLMKPFLPARELLESIPGFSQILAEIFIAETGGDMTQFPTAGHLASWAGVSPGSNESAGRVKSTKTRPGNRYLKGALGVAALSGEPNPNSYLGARYRRLASPRGPIRPSSPSNTPCSPPPGTWAHRHLLP